MEIDAVAKSYARWAPIYDKTFGVVTQCCRRAATGYINALQGPEVLELGVGTGLALPLYAADRQVTGVDFSEDMLAKAKNRVDRMGLSHVKRLRRMDVRALDFPDACFDAVAAMHVISVVPDPDKVLAEAARVLRPGGQLVMSNHFARERGLLARAERWSAPFSNLLGWHSDFPISAVTGAAGLRVMIQRPLPPLGLMTFLVMEKPHVA
ncbi:MAG: class I SAM-dependent methyltransferase [Qingshengfaniella sp.]